MKVTIHNRARTVDACGRKSIHLLIVTTEATYCEAKMTDFGSQYGLSASVFSGTIWPAELPEIFEGHNPPYLRAEIANHFRESVAPLTVTRQGD